VIIPEVTVVIPTHNRPSLLRQCVDAALHQRDVRHEVVIVDDGSNVPLALARNPRLTVVRHDRRRGVAAARNTGLARASGRWVAFCDDDDLWAPHKLATQLAAMADQPGADWSCCAAAFVNDELQLIAGEPAPGSGDVSELLCGMNAILAGGSGVVADSAVVRSVGGFDPGLSMLADWDLWLRLATRGPVVSVPAALVAYRMHATATAMSAHHQGTEEELARSAPRTPGPPAR
jgi:glycosyltransferase involved in cell wall biosynthesis